MNRVSHDAIHMIKVGFTSLCFFLSSILNDRSSVRVFTFLFAARIRNSIKLIHMIVVIFTAVKIGVKCKTMLT